MSDKLKKTIEIINKKIVKEKYYNCKMKIEGYDEEDSLFIIGAFNTKSELIKHLQETDFLDLIKYFKLNIIRDAFNINYSSSDEDE
jgi:hypothetical protein